MQDGASGHAAGATQNVFQERGVSLIFWPPFSPDLNPIETVWDWMKKYIQQHFPEKMSYNRLREAVKEAWEVITEAELDSLMDEMGDRCQNVIDADGKFTRY